MLRTWQRQLAESCHTSSVQQAEADADVTSKMQKGCKDEQGETDAHQRWGEEILSLTKQTPFSHKNQSHTHLAPGSSQLPSKQSFLLCSLHPGLLHRLSQEAQL